MDNYQEKDNLYNEQYYKSCCGVDGYIDSELIIEFFKKIAQNIKDHFNPATVLDAGCACGHLVAALRDLGIEAYGIDISEYAINQVRDDIKPYCVVAPLQTELPDSFPKKYDFIAHIEVIEHIQEPDAIKVLASLCKLSDRILFSSSPSDITEPTHVNVHPVEYWVSQFADHGFFPLMDHSHDYLTPYAMVFERSSAFPNLMSSFAKSWWQAKQAMSNAETRCRELESGSQCHELKLECDRLEQNRKDLKLDMELKCNELELARDKFEQSYNSIRNATAWKITKPVRKILDFLKRSRRPAVSAETSACINTDSDTTSRRLPEEDIKRVMLYMHFDVDDIIDPHILYQLKAIKDLGCDIIFISNSQLPDEEKDKVKPLTEDIIIRENRGYDWAAWRDTLFVLGVGYFEKYDELLFMNCTCYGPLFPLSEMFDEMDQRECDFWMPTKHIACNNIPEHGQPYLLIVRKALFTSDAFWNFWKHIKGDYSFWSSVLQGEIRFTTELSKAGFKYSIYAELQDTRPLPEIGFVEAYILNYADWLIRQHRLPLVKVKAFASRDEKPFSTGGDIIREITNSDSDYPLELIYSHQRRCSPLSWHKNLPGTLNVIPDNTPVISRKTNTPVAVIGHFYYPDRFKDTLKHISKIPCHFDLLATTTKQENVHRIEQLAKEHLAGKVDNIIVKLTTNRGRDAAPWLMAFREEHLRYDIALKIQSKKHGHLTSAFGFKWNEYLFDSMLASPGYISNIINMFDSEEKLGILFPPYTPIFNMVCSRGFSGSPGDQVRMANLLDRVGVVCPKETNQPIFPTGLFWYRPKALKRLLNTDFSLNEFQPEPFPLHGTIAHAIERVIPYVVQGHGFYYKLAMSTNTFIPSYQMYEDRIMSSYGMGSDFYSYEENLPGLRGSIKLLGKSFSRYIKKKLRLTPK